MTPADKRLVALRRVTHRRQAAEAAWHDSIRAAHTAGIPIRKIGEAAGVSHVRVLQIVRGD